MIRRRQPRSWMLLISVICGLLYLSLQYSPQDFMAPTNTGKKRVYPDTYLLGVEDTRYNPEGQLRYRLTADEVIYHTGGTTPYSQILNPDIIIEGNPDNPPWHLTARRGHSGANAAEVTLEDDVKAWSRHPDYGLIEVLTDNLSIDTERQFAQTDKPVTMRSAHSTTTAVGLRAELEAGRVEFLSEVKGTYDPQ